MSFLQSLQKTLHLSHDPLESRINRDFLKNNPSLHPSPHPSRHLSRQELPARNINLSVDVRDEVRDDVRDKFAKFPLFTGVSDT